MANDPSITTKSTTPSQERVTTSQATGPDLSAASFAGTDLMNQAEAKITPLTAQTFAEKWSRGASFPDTGTTISVSIRKGAKAA
jgi:hypothetical protein